MVERCLARRKSLSHRINVHVIGRKSLIPVAEVDVDREWKLVELLHHDKIAGVASLSAIQRCWIKESRRRSVNLVFALIEEVLLCVILIVFVSVVG